ncbi:MAG: tryptophan--tRNA ligase [Trueperaceae bacterium]
MTTSTSETPSRKEQSGAKPRVFSGVQPTSTPHIGNYVGALRQWVEQQHEGENIFCVVDLHALTIPEEIDPQQLRSAVRSVAALYLAVGIDPERSIVFVQSHVPEHSELAWLLNCVTPLGWLYRMTQFKSKSEERESVGAGLLNYPVLMASDILLYDTDRVPVGDDQVQHIELTRDVAVRFNNLFGDTFVIPKAVIPKVGARIMGLDDPEAKMSKSVAAKVSGHAIGLLDDEKRIKKSIMSAVTDSGREVRFDHASPGVRNLLTIHQALTGQEMAAIEAEFEGAGYGHLKKAVVASVTEALAPIQARYHEYLADEAELDRVLAVGAERARAVAAETMKRVRHAVGVG